jgi:subfamily B ATP-binding cassette protein MsbA
MLAFIQKLLAIARPYRLRLVLGIIMGICSGLCEPLLIPLITLIADTLFASGGDSKADLLLNQLPSFLRDMIPEIKMSLSATSHSSPAAVIMLVFLIPLLMFLRGLFEYLNAYFMQWAAVRAVTDLRTKLFAHLIAQPVSFYREAKTGDLISRIVTDTTTVQTTLNQSITSLVRDPASIIGILSVLFWTNPKWTAMALLIFPVSILPVALFARKVRKSSREIQNQLSETSNVMHESFSGVRVVKAYGLEGEMENQFLATTSRYITNFMRLVRAKEMPGPLLELIASFGIATFFLYIGLFANPKPTAGEFLGFIIGIYSLYKPVKNLTKINIQLHQAQAASERVFEMLAVKNTMPEPAQPKPLKAAGAEIHFDKIQFAYGDKPVLRSIDLVIKPGQLVALVGSSGSGKTTLSNLLLRFDDPQSGAVRIGGVDIREFSTAALRSQIAVVTQDNILFNETIRRNIELGRQGASEAEIIAAAKHAHAHEFILAKPQGYDTVVGEKGVSLSGGQKQRLAIARAVVRNAPILILDEATSALDTESERAVQSALDELMRGRTTLCIAHRLSTILHADVIVVLEQGRIVEMGRHEELVKRGGLYQKLHDMQFQS